MDKEYIFVIIDKDDNNKIKTITTNIIYAYDIAKQCSNPRLEIWFYGDYVDGCGADENASLQTIFMLMVRYDSNQYSNYIKIYDFKEAPKEYQELSSNGGGEEWIVIVGIDMYKNHNEYLPWLESGTGFGLCRVEKIKLSNGEFVFIVSNS